MDTVFIVIGQTPISNFVKAVFTTREEAEAFIADLDEELRTEITDVYDHQPYIEEHTVYRQRGK